MLGKVTSKGQLVIPKRIRDRLGIAPGTEVHIEVVGDKILLEPITPQFPVEALYGRYPGTDLLSDLEAEHYEELRADETLRA